MPCFSWKYLIAFYFERAVFYLLIGPIRVLHKRLWGSILPMLWIWKITRGGAIWFQMNLSLSQIVTRSTLNRCQKWIRFREIRWCVQTVYTRRKLAAWFKSSEAYFSHWRCTKCCALNDPTSITSSWKVRQSGDPQHEYHWGDANHILNHKVPFDIMVYYDYMKPNQSLRCLILLQDRTR